MAWSTIRRATDDDKAKLAAAAERFCNRHGIDTGGFSSANEALDCECSASYGCSADQQDRAKRLTRLWTSIVRRALNEPNAEGIADGYVGYHVD